MTYTPPTSATALGTLTVTQYNTEVKANIEHIYAYGTALAGTAGTAWNVTAIAGTAGTAVNLTATQGSVATIYTTYSNKGDILVGTASNKFLNLSVGTNFYAIVADTTQATGLRYYPIRYPVSRYQSTTGQTIGTSETVVLSGTIQANSINAGDHFFAKIYCKRNLAVYPDFTASGTVKIRIGTATLTGTVVSSYTAGANTGGYFDYEIAFVSAGTNANVIGICSLTETGPIASIGSAVVDTTKNNLIEITMASGSGTQLYTNYSGLLEKISA